ncbi:MAG: hypothetical protein Q8P67_05525 [archaeon]|nr:hypothetical protein [archaeon]
MPCVLRSSRGFDSTVGYVHHLLHHHRRDFGLLDHLDHALLKLT